MNLKNLLKKHKRNIKKTAVAAVEEALPDVETNDETANSVIKNSISELESYIDEVATVTWLIHKQLVLGTLYRFA